MLRSYRSRTPNLGVHDAPISAFTMTGIRTERSGPVVEHWSNPVRDLAAACARAGIAKVSPNDLRRSYASWLKQGGQDIVTRYI